MSTENTDLLTPKSIGTLSAISGAVWITTNIICSFAFKNNQLIVALVLSQLISIALLIQNKKRKKTLLLYLMTFMNGCLITSAALGINTYSTGSETPDGQKAALLSVFNENAWLAPTDLVQEKQNIVFEVELMANQLSKKETEFLTNNTNNFTTDSAISINQPSPAIAKENTLPANKNIEPLSEKRQKIVAEAIALLEKNIPFVWGGKKVTKGFDSSGFVAYVLAKSGILGNPELFWSGMLRETFDTTDVLQPGDLLFYEGGICAIYINTNEIITMVPDGLKKLQMEKIGFKLISKANVDSVLKKNSDN